MRTLLSPALGRYAFCQLQLTLRAPCTRTSNIHRSRRGFWFRAQTCNEPQCLYQGFSNFNEVVTVLQIPDEPSDPQHRPLAGSRILLLDRTGNLHSIYHPDRVLTSSYWDVLATLPSFVPPGPVGLLGLGAGTIPRIVDAHYPTILADGGGDAGKDAGEHKHYVVHGWELDPGVVMASRMFLGMAELEQRGSMVANTGDALSPDASLPDGFSGVIVDLFAGGCLLPQLTKKSTWEAIKSRLAPGAGPRVMANLGQAPPSVPGQRWAPEAYTTLRAHEAMEAAFEGEVSLMRCQDNVLALTGPLPRLDEWPEALPEGLRHLGEMGSWVRDMYPLQSSFW